MFIVPRPYSPYFFERPGTLTALHDRLRLERLVALVGPGGVGKSRLAVAYAECHRSLYPLVLWLPGGSAVRCEMALEGLSAPLRKLNRVTRSRSAFFKIPDAAEDRQSVRRLLYEADDYLLIVDGLADLAVLKQANISLSSLRGRVIITSRNEEIRASGASLLRLEGLTHDESQQFLMDYHPHGDDPRAMSVLATLLQGQPLALSLAGACLAAHRSSAREYAYRCFTEERALTALGFVETCPEAAAAIPLSLSLAHLENESPSALDLLKLCAFLNEGEIPEELFIEPAAETGMLLPPLDEVPRRAPEPEPGGRANFERILKPLREHQLLWRDPVSGELSMHRVVQELLRRNMPVSEQVKWVLAGVHQVNGKLALGNSESQAFKRLFPTELTLAEWIRRTGISTLACHTLLVRVASQLAKDYLLTYVQPYNDLIASTTWGLAPPSALSAKTMTPSESRIALPPPPPSPSPSPSPPPAARRISSPPAELKRAKPEPYKPLSELFTSHPTIRVDPRRIYEEFVEQAKNSPDQVSPLILAILKGLV